MEAADADGKDNAEEGEGEDFPPLLPRSLLASQTNQCCTGRKEDYEWPGVRAAARSKDGRPYFDLAGVISNALAQERSPGGVKSLRNHVGIYCLD